MRIAIVGAGMAGLACATRLVSSAHEVVLFDKGRSAGGRMSTRRLSTKIGEASFDHGAQYLTARDPDFVGQVEAWVKAELLAPWPAAGLGAWVGLPGMNAPIKDLASCLDVRWSSRITALQATVAGWQVRGAGVDDERFDLVVLALPAEQTAPFVEPIDAALADEIRKIKSAPCWTVMAVFGERLAIDEDILREQGIIGWAARNSAKPRRTEPESWIVQAGPEWSTEHLEDGVSAVEQALVQAFAQASGRTIPEPLVVASHRWRYARSGRLGRDFCWNQTAGLGVCGDWLLGPRIECAWMSGDRLARTVGPARHDGAVRPGDRRCPRK